MRAPVTLVTLALALALLAPAPSVAKPKKGCTDEQQHAAKMVTAKVEAVDAKNKAEDAVKKARGELDAALKAAKTYDQDLARARTNLEARSRDVSECRKRRQNNDCSAQEKRQQHAQEELGKLESNPPSKRIPAAQQKLEQAQDALAVAKERVAAAERAVKEANERLATCQKSIG